MYEYILLMGVNIVDTNASDHDDQDKIKLSKHPRKLRCFIVAVLIPVPKKITYSVSEA